MNKQLQKCVKPAFQSLRQKRLLFLSKLLAIRKTVAFLTILLFATLELKSQVSITSNQTWGTGVGEIPPPTSFGNDYREGISIGGQYTLTIKSSAGTLSMNAGKSINVSSGGILILDGVTITSSNPSGHVTWAGIVCTGPRLNTSGNAIKEQFLTFPDPNGSTTADWDGVLNIYTNAGASNPSQSCVLTSGGKISHALKGIYSIDGGIVRCRGTIFEDDQIGSDISAYESNVRAEVNACYFMDCTFKWTKTMPSYTLADLKGISLRSIQGVNIGGCTFTNDDITKHCKNERGTGVYADNATFAVSTSGTTFCTDALGCYVNCGTTRCVFTKLSFGINYINSAGRGLGVNSSDFKNNITDIYAQMVSGNAGIVKIYKNNFTGGTRTDLDAVFDNSGAGTCYASTTLIKNIDLLNCPNDIYDNQFDFVGSNINHITITTNSNGGRISNNTFTNSNTNTIYTDNVIGIKALGSNNREEIYCNKFHSMGIDIKVATGATVRTPVRGRDANMAYATDANNEFSDLLTNRYRFDNSGNTNITYCFSSTLPKYNPYNTPTSWNVTQCNLGFEPSCALTCEKLFTKINDISFGNLLSVYPNPSSTTFTITSKNETIKMISIYNQLGQLVFQSNNLNIFEVNIETANIVNGIYSVNVTLDNNTSISKKVVVFK